MMECQLPVTVEQIEELRQQNIGRLFLRAHRAYSTHAVTKLRERGHHGLGLAHTTLLSNLDLEGTRITTLAERAGMTKQSMGQLVLDLEKQGYVQRTPDPTDGRATIVRFTDTGWQFLGDAYDLKLELESEYTAILGVQGMRELRDLLSKLVSVTEQIKSDDSSLDDWLP